VNHYKVTQVSGISYIHNAVQHHFYLVIRHFHHTKRWPPYPLSSHPPCLLFPAQLRGVYSLTVWICLFWHPYKWKHTIGDFVSGTSYSNTLLCGKITVCLPVQQFMDIWFVSTFWLFWIMALYGYLWKSICILYGCCQSFQVYLGTAELNIILCLI
jgi:hypothetical protein